MPHKRIRSSVVVATLALGFLLAVFGIAGVSFQTPVAADPPDPTPGASQPVREQNLDAAGLIRVHEQGTADVNVTNMPLDVQGSVDVGNFPDSFEVSNFPAVQDVNVISGELSEVKLAPITHVTTANLNASPDQEDIQFFPTVNATSVLISKVDEEVLIELETPLSVLDIQAMADFDGESNWFQLTFVHPLPVNGARIFCWNESELCSVTVQVFGFSGT